MSKSKRKPYPNAVPLKTQKRFLKEFLKGMANVGELDKLRKRHKKAIKHAWRDADIEGWKQAWKQADKYSRRARLRVDPRSA